MSSYCLNEHAFILNFKCSFWSEEKYKLTLCHCSTAQGVRGKRGGFSQTLTWISCMSVHPACTRNRDRNHSYTSSRGNACMAWLCTLTQQRVLCLWALLMGMRTSIRYESSYREGALVLTHKQVPHQQRGKSCLLWQRIRHSSHWPQSPQMRR